jgi:UDP-N-acetylglucosamine 4,6-dehydratase/5-epimerase
MFKNKTLLITGGTGSFGNAVLKQFISSDIKEIRIFSRDEKKQNDMRIKYNSEKLKFYIGDVRNYNSIFDCVVGVDYIFHAAALKQVPSCEFFPIEATKTNVFGTENLIRAAIFHKVKKVICLSTDKAAYPINAMGISKALMEKTALAHARNIKNEDTVICITRYGNVMASRGSVIPLFIDQIKNKKNITITDGNMTRFLMSLDDAVNLVIFAFKNGNQGDMFIHKAPATTIEKLAKSLLDLFKSKSRIVNIGTRHGEKLYETLCTREEMLKSTLMENYYRIPIDERNLNYDKYYDSGEQNISEFEDYNSHNTNQLSDLELKNILLNLDIIKNNLS